MRHWRVVTHSTRRRTSSAPGHEVLRQQVLGVPWIPVRGQRSRNWSDSKAEAAKYSTWENEAERDQRWPSTERALFSGQYSKLDDKITSPTEKNLPSIEMLSLPVGWRSIILCSRYKPINTFVSGLSLLFLACTWRHEILKSKIKELPKLLFTSGRRGANFISVNIFFSLTAYFVWKPAHFEFQSYGGAWHRLMIVFGKNI